MQPITLDAEQRFMLPCRHIETCNNQLEKLGVTRQHAHTVLDV
jgi:hypothetical protein